MSKAVREGLKAAVIAAIVIGTGGLAAFGGAGFLQTIALGSSIFQIVAVGVATAVAVSNSKGLDNLNQNFGSKLTVAEPIAPRQIIYGQTKVGGNVVFMDTTGTDNSELHMVVAIAGHEINSIEKIFIDDTEVTTTTSTINTETVYTVTNAKFTNTENEYTSGSNGFGSGRLIRYTQELGSDTQESNGYLVNNTDFTTDHDLKGVAYVYFHMIFDRNKLNRIPKIQFEVKGKKLYDPRSGETAWTDTSNVDIGRNPALIVRDILTDTRYGLKATTGSGGEINDSTNAGGFANAATACETTITDGSGGTEAKYYADGFSDMSTNQKDIIEGVLSSCGGKLSYSNGQFGMFVGTAQTPSLTITDDDLVSDVQLSHSTALGSTYNTVKAIYVDASDNYEPTDAPLRDTGEDSSGSAVDYLTVDTPTGGTEANFRRTLEMKLPFVTRQTQAQRLSKLALDYQRRTKMLTLSTSLKFLQVQPSDWVYVTNERLGFTNKVFEVLSVNTETGGGDNPSLFCKLQLKEIDSNVFAFVAGDYITQASDGSIGDSGDFTLGAPTLASDGLTEVTYNDNGTFKVSLDVAWTNSESAGIEKTEVQWRIASTTFGDPTATAEVEPDVTTFRIPDLGAGQTVYVRVRHTNSNGAGTFSTVRNITLTGDSTAPDQITDLTATTDIEGTILVRWTNPDNNDLRSIKVYRKTTNVTPTDDTNLVTTISGEPNKSSSVTQGVEENLSPNINYYFWVKAVDYSGNEGTISSSATGKFLPLSDDLIGGGGGGFFLFNVAGDTNAPSDSAFNTQEGRLPKDNDIVRVLDTTNNVSKAYKYSGQTANSLGGGGSFSDAGELIAGDLILATSKIQAGEINTPNSGDRNIAILDGKDPLYRMYAGGVGGNAPFNVKQTGQVTARSLVLKKSDGTTYFDSTNGFTAEAISQIASSLNTRVQTFAFTASENYDSSDDTTYLEITTTDTTTVSLKVIVDLVEQMQGSGSTEAICKDQFPDDITLTIQYASDAAFTSPTTVGTTQTFTKDTNGTVTSSEYEISTIDLSDFGGTGFNGFISPNTGAVDSNGEITYEPADFSLSAGTYYFRVTLGTSDAQHDQTGETNSPVDLTRILEIEDTTGNGFTVNNAQTSGAQQSDAVLLAGDQNISGTKTFTGSLVVSGTFQTTGSSTTIDSTNTTIADALIELNNGGASVANTNDLGLILERGTTGDNGFIGFDESIDYFRFATTTATGASTGDLTLTDAKLRVGTLNLSGTDVSATATELNKLDGATLSTTELNYVTGVTSAIQTQLDAKYQANDNITVGTIDSGNITSTGVIKTDLIQREGDGLSGFSFLDFDMDTGASAGTNNVVLAGVNNVDFLIDTNNNSSSSAFVFGKDANTMSAGTQLMSLNEDGDLDLKTGDLLVNAGDIILSSATPVISFTDTDTNADSEISASSGAGNIAISADKNNEAVNTVIDFKVDGTTKFYIGTDGFYAVSQKIIDASTRNLENIGTIDSGAITTSDIVTLDYTAPMLRLKPDNGAFFQIRANESPARLEVGHSSNKNLYLSNTGNSTFNYDLTVSGTIDSGAITSTDKVKGASLETDRYIYHAGDTNTYIDFGTDEINLHAGGGANAERVIVGASSTNVTTRLDIGTPPVAGQTGQMLHIQQENNSTITFRPQLELYADLNLNSSYNNLGSITFSSNDRNSVVQSKVDFAEIRGFAENRDTVVTNPNNDGQLRFLVRDQNGLGERLRITHDEVEVYTTLKTINGGVTLSYPTSDGTSGQALTTDGSGNLTFSTISGYSDSDVESYLDANGLTLPDNVKAQFGASNDLQIYHNGTDSFITNDTGIMYIRQNLDDGDILLQSDNGSGGVTTYIQLDGSAQLTNFAQNTKHNDSVKATFGASQDLQIYHDGNDSYVDDAGTGILFLRGNGAVKIQKYTGEAMIDANADGSVYLYNDNDIKLQTTASGINVTGRVNTDTAFIGTGNTANISHGALVINHGTLPQILFDGGGDTNLDIAVPNGEVLQIGHWNTTTSSAVLRLSMESGGTFDFEGNPIQGVGGLTVNGDISLPDGASTIEFGGSGQGGPHGLNFADDDGTTVFRALYRTSPNTLTFENAGESAKHTFDLNGNYTNTGEITVGSLLKMAGGSGNPISFMGTGTDANYRNFAYEASDHHYVTNRHTNGDLVLMSNNGTGGAETTRMTLQGGSGTQDIDITNANLDLNSNNITGVGTIGVGTSDPERLLHVYNGDTGITPNTNAWVVVENNGLSFLNLLGSNGSVKGILFSGNSSNSDGRVTYDDDGRDLQFFTAGLKRYRIDSSGNFQVGSTPQTVIDQSRNLSNIGTYSGTGDMTISKSGTPTLTIETSVTSGQDAFLKIRGARTSASASYIGLIQFDNKTSSPYTLGTIIAKDPAGSHTLGRGSLTFQTSSGGTLSDALVLGHDQSATFSGTISSGAITASSVAFSDTNAVIYRNSNDLELITYAGYDINLMPSGKVGIGTQSPRHKLSVNGTLGSSVFSGFGLGVIGGLATAESGNTNRAIGLQSDATGDAKLFAYDYGASAGIPIKIQPDNANVYICSGGGNVSVGGTNAEEKLQVEGNIRIHGGTGGKGAQLDFGDDYRVIEYTTNDTLALKSPENMVFVIDNNNNETDKIFQWKANTNDADTGGTSLMTLNESGNLTVSGTISSGAIDAGGVIDGVGGNATTPSYIFEGDTNTGLFHPAADTIAFATGGTERFRITSTGNFQVGSTPQTVIDQSRNLTNIGTVTTSGKLNVGNASTSGRNMIEIQTDANTSDRGIAFKNSGNAFSNAIFAEDVGGNDARLVFCCGNSTTNLANLQRSFMVDNQSGGGGVSGDIHARGDVVAFSSTISSDERLKYDIEDIKNPLDIIQSLKGRHFKWKKNDQQSSGVIAQEVEQSEMSFLVSDKVNIDNPDETIKRVKYDGFVGVLIEAIKEQQKQIDELKAKLK